MLEVQKKTTKNFSAPLDKNDGGIFFTAEEWAYLEKEIAKQIEEGSRVIDYKKAINNARYLATLDESLKQAKEGKIVSFSGEEWEKFVGEQEFH